MSTGVDIEVKFEAFNYHPMRVKSLTLLDLEQHEANIKALVENIESDNIPRWVTKKTIHLFKEINNES